MHLEASFDVHWVSFDLLSDIDPTRHFLKRSLFLVILQGQHNLRVAPLDSAYLLLNILLSSLVKSQIANVEDLTVNLSHESHGDIRHEVENIDGCPGTSAVEMCRVRQRVGTGGLKQDGSLGEETTSLVVPLLNGGNVLLSWAVFDPPIVVKFFTKDG